MFLSRLDACAPRYRGVPTEEGNFDVEAPLRRDALVAFEWRARGDGFDETYLVKARCNHVLERGVPLPSPWRTTLRCLNLYVLAENAAKAAREGEEERRLHDARCLFLGQPKSSVLPPPDAELVPGATVRLEHLEYLLCAHVKDGTWLCHRGSFKDASSLDERNPFDEEDLEIKDFCEAPEHGPPKKRLRAHLEAGHLRETALAEPRPWNRLVAIAAYEAEKLRAEPFDEALALRGFEPSP